MKKEKTTEPALYEFASNWSGIILSFRTLQDAKREAKKYTYGFPVYIYCRGEVVATVQPDDEPLP